MLEIQTLSLVSLSMIATWHDSSLQKSCTEVESLLLGLVSESEQLLLGAFLSSSSGSFPFSKLWFSGLETGSQSETRFL